MLLSEYVDSLDGVPKSRYFDKLKVLGLAATDDPYRPYASGDFQNAMRLWSLHTTGAAPMEAARSVQLFQEWIHQDQPAPIAEINFSQPKRRKDCNTSTAEVPQESSTSRIHSPTFEEQEMFLKGLKAMRPNAAILTAVIPIPQKETDSHTPAIRTLPPNIMSLHYTHATLHELNEEELKLECK